MVCEIEGILQQCVELEHAYYNSYNITERKINHNIIMLKSQVFATTTNNKNLESG